MAIDEIQSVPELMTEIKLRVDRDKTPGQFAITGSANLLEMRRVKDSLAGRAEDLPPRFFESYVEAVLDRDGALRRPA